MAHRLTLRICLTLLSLWAAQPIFGSAPLPPSVTTETLGDAEVGVTSAALKATVDTYAQAASVKFRFWPDATPASVSETAGQSVSSDGSTLVSALVTGLAENTVYSFQAIATVGDMVTEGNIVGFTTDTNLPPATVAHVFFFAGSATVSPLGPNGDYDQNIPPDPLHIVQLIDASSAATITGNGAFISYTPQLEAPAELSLSYKVADALGAAAIGAIRLIDFRSRDGFYDGSFHDPVTGRDGRISLSMGGSGSISLQSRFSWSGGTVLRLKGFFDSEGKLALSLKADPANPNSADLQLALALDPDSQVIRASLVERDSGGAIVASIPEFVLMRNASTGGELAPGVRTAFLEVPSTLPELTSATADGFLSLKVGTDKRRRARIAGRMPDGEPFLVGVAASGRTYSLYKKLEKGGSLFSLIRILEASAAGTGGMVGELAWKKRASNSAQYYRGDIDAVMPLEGVDYSVDAAGSPSIGLSAPNASTGNARLHFNGGNLAGGYRDVLVNLLPKSAQVIGPDPLQAGQDFDLRRMAIKVHAANATFTGHFLHPQTHRVISFSGGFRAAFDNEGGSGRGIFRSQRVVGSVSLEPNGP